MRVFELHGDELSLGFGAGELELFDVVGNFLEATRIVFFLKVRGVRDDEEGGLFEENDFVGLTDLPQLLQPRFDHFNVWNQRVDDGRPGFVESFVPDGGAASGNFER